MNTDTVKKYKAMYVEWIDSTMKLPVWFTTGKLDEETKEPSDRFQTISYLVRENDKEYIFASSIHFTDNEVSSFGQIFTIPKGCVIKMVGVLIPNSRKSTKNLHNK